VVAAVIALVAVAAGVKTRRRRHDTRARVTLERAVAEAQFAVLAAQAAGAPVGELDVLGQRLGEVVRGAAPSSAADFDLLTAARMIQDAAAAAVAAQTSFAEQADDVHGRAVAIAALIAQAGQFEAD
jgi:hypothetical protein